MRVSVEREDGRIFLAVAEIGGPGVTLRIFPGGANSLSALLAQAAGAGEDYAGGECVVRGELEIKSEKSSAFP